MPGATRNEHARSPLLIALLLLSALLMRIAVPLGWMPMQTADGWRITLCSGSGPIEMSAVAHMMAMPGMAPMTGGHRHHDDHGAAEHPCAFSALAMTLAEPIAPTLPEPLTVPGAWLLAIGRIVTLGHGLAAPPPPATGPPPTA